LFYWRRGALVVVVVVLDLAILLGGLPLLEHRVVWCFFVF
jgi:hypothetical protein